MAVNTGTEEDGYRLLASYYSKILAANPGSTGYVESTPWFQRSYLSLKQFRLAATHTASTSYFFDFAHFKGRLKGGVLSASTVDANNHIVVVAGGITAEETELSWEAFMEQLMCEEEPEFRQWLQHEDMVVFIDRKPGLIVAVQKTLEESYNTHYV